MNYSLSTYGRFEDKNNALQFIFGIGRLEFDSDRQDGNELLTGEREANQLFGSLAFIRSFNNEDSNWLISPYLRLDGSYTRFDKYSENGGEAALTFDELTLSNAKASIGTDISYLFAESKFNAMPYLTLEYGYDYSKTSNQNMYYTLQGPSINYILDLDDGMKAHNWEVDLGLMLQISLTCLLISVVDGKADLFTYPISQVFLITIFRLQKFALLNCCGIFNRTINFN